MATAEFIKMHSLGNDFLIFDERNNRFTLSKDQIAHISSRNFGIGCDQMIIIDNDPSGEIFMRIFNANGTEVEACGNATRCVAWLICTESGKKNTVIKTRNRTLKCELQDNNMVVCDMQNPVFDYSSIIASKSQTDAENYIKYSLLSHYTDLVTEDAEHNPDAQMPERQFDSQLYSISAAICRNKLALVNMGNPHCVLFFKKEDIMISPSSPEISSQLTDEEYREYEKEYLEFSMHSSIIHQVKLELGAFVEAMPMMLNKVNVSLCYIKSGDEMEVFFWERDIGYSTFCGTASCAAAAAAIKLGYVENSVALSVPGSVHPISGNKSPVNVSWKGGDKDSVFISAPVTFLGLIEVDLDFISQ